MNQKIKNIFACSAYPAVMGAGLCIYYALLSRSFNLASSSYVAAIIGGLGMITLLELALPYRKEWLPNFKEIKTDAIFMGLIQVLLPFLLSILAITSLGDYAKDKNWPLYSERKRTLNKKRKTILRSLYSTAELTKDTEVTGPIKVALYVSTSAVSTDFTAKLVDVYPDGSSYNIAEGILRKEYQQPQTEPEAIEIELSPTSNLFKSGHKIRLEISSSSFPRYDRNTNTGELFYQAKDTTPATQTVYHSTKYPSRITLPMVSGKDPLPDGSN